MYETDVQKADPGEVTAFARAMHLAGVFADPQEMLDVVENPTRWRQEFKLWSVLLRPIPPASNWSSFAGLVLRGEGAVRLFLHQREEMLA